MRSIFLRPFFGAAKRSLELRLDNGGGNTGWSCAWAMALLARFNDSERLEESVKRLFRDSTCENLFDLHPPHIFQIDGNFGATAAIGEMLVQNRSDEIVLLPCIPSFMKDGTARGLRAKGGATVNIEWKNGQLSNAELIADHDREYALCCNGKHVKVSAKAGERVTIVNI